MRLLDVETYQLKTFLGNDKPDYAILSHTWEEDEVLFEDIKTPSSKWGTRKGSYKVEHSCRQAQIDGYDYIWIDTCCINKDSSTELSEAINSMFAWYNEAAVCYAYLSDVDEGDMASFRKCRWFSRGWTLQELIAPEHVEFFDKRWDELGSRESLADHITKATGIDRSVIVRGHLEVRYTPPTDSCSPPGPSMCRHCGFFTEKSIKKTMSEVSVAQRMYWASKRSTTRKEDMAYCLMGIFDVNMPLLYGEGEKAFLRLQREIYNTTSDQSILAFNSDSNYLSFPLLASQPNEFCGGIQYWQPDVGHSSGMTLSKRDLTVDMFICPALREDGTTDLAICFGVLDCTFVDDYLSLPAIRLRQIHPHEGKFKREGGLFRLREGHVELITPQYPKVLRPVPTAFDATRIERRTITITYGVESIRDLFSPGKCLGMLQLNVSSSLFQGLFSMDRTTNPLTGMMFQQGIWDPQNVMSFTAISASIVPSSFCIAWGSSYPNYWCEVLTPDDLVGQQYVLDNNGKGKAVVQDFIEDVEAHKAWRRNTYARGRYVKNRIYIQDLATQSQLVVRVKLEMKHFMEREVIQLNISAERVGQHSEMTGELSGMS